MRAYVRALFITLYFRCFFIRFLRTRRRRRTLSRAMHVTRVFIVHKGFFFFLLTTAAAETATDNFYDVNIVLPDARFIPRGCHERPYTSYTNAKRDVFCKPEVDLVFRQNTGTGQDLIVSSVPVPVPVLSCCSLKVRVPDTNFQMLGLGFRFRFQTVTVLLPVSKNNFLY